MQTALRGKPRRGETMREQDPLSEVDVKWIKAFVEMKHVIFAPDANIEDAEVYKDTMIYLELSVLRYMQVLKAHGVEKGRYTFYWDSNSLSLDKFGKPQVRHAFHVHDWKYGFNDKELEEYNRLQSNPSGNSHRENCRRMCHNYIRRIRTELKIERIRESNTEQQPSNFNDILREFDDLIANSKTETRTALVIAGPYTEAMNYIKNTHTPITVTTFVNKDYMHYKWHSIDLADKEATESFTSWMFGVGASVCFRLIPTSKLFEHSTIYGDRSFSPPNFAEILGDSSLICRTIQQYHDERFTTPTLRNGSYEPYRFLLGLEFEDDGAFEWCKLSLYEEGHGNSFNEEGQLIVTRVEKILRRYPNKVIDSKIHKQWAPGYFVIKSDRRPHMHASTNANDSMLLVVIDVRDDELELAADFAEHYVYSTFSDQRGYPQAQAAKSETNPFTAGVLIFQQAISPGDLFAIQEVLHHFRDTKEHVAIIISPRAVDLSVPRYGDRYTDLAKKVGKQKMERPILEGSDTRWIEALDPGDRQWFYPDQTLNQSVAYSLGRPRPTLQQLGVKNDSLFFPRPNTQYTMSAKLPATGVHSAKQEEFEAVTSIDLADPDNTVMLEQLLVYFKHVHAILTFRVADMSVRRYPKEDFKRLMDQLGRDPKGPSKPLNRKQRADRLIRPIRGPELAWVYDLSTEDQDWFYFNADYRDPQVKQDTQFDGHQEKSKVGPGNSRHDDTSFRQICHDECGKYIVAVANEFNLETESAPHRLKDRSSVLRNLGDLVAEHKAAERNIHLIIGGPFIEALKYVRETRAPKKVLALCGNWGSNINVFPNQFNIHADVESAQKFLEYVEQNKISCKLVPTECAKGSKVDDGMSNCPFELTIKNKDSNKKDDWATVLKKLPLLYKSIVRYDKDKEEEGAYEPFDWVTALTIKHPDLFKWNKVKVGEAMKGDDKLITFTSDPKAKDNEYRIEMASDEGLAERKPALIAAMLEMTANLDGRIGS
ncbi:hypothetical protein BDV96DRAFT_593960 [Lophiotrema nucula]|uniref:Uncharacterized protein n=1 Tax=Lophiotrema nucula TaxID=690887 RepID=A0A6A5ZQR6_9PLEO|nr:hypothetical protein BDV96DRAFT_593960 [Lophiotrema nucula]